MTDILGFIWWVLSNYPFESIYVGALLGMFVCMFLEDATVWLMSARP